MTGPGIRELVSRFFPVGRLAAKDMVRGPAMAGATFSMCLSRVASGSSSTSCSTIRSLGSGGAWTGIAMSRLHNASMGFLNATAHDLSPFRDAGREDRDAHRLVDPILPGGRCHQVLRGGDRSHGRPEKTKEFFRLFMAPGMGHCNGGPGPNSLDALSGPGGVGREGHGAGADSSPLARARAVPSNARDRLCVYPQVARWTARAARTMPRTSRA